MYLFIFGEEVVLNYLPAIFALNFTCISGTVILILGGLYMLGITVAHYHNPALPSLRSEFKSNTKREDKYLLLVHLFAFLILLIIISRAYHGKTSIPIQYIIAGTIIRTVGYTIKLWALKTNCFLATTICIQKGHKVIDTGPYAIVRHPFYTSTILTVSSLPLVYGSIAGLWFSMLFIIHKIIRIGVEESTLLKDLEGYKQYTQKVKYRLLPYIY